MSSFLAHLLSITEDASRSLGGVSRKKMFGCETLFVDGSIFALIWKTGRIGLKLPEESAYTKLASMPGAEPWSPGGKMKMGSWLLVPESFHDDDDALGTWVKAAHRQVRERGEAITRGAGARKPTSSIAATSKKATSSKKAATSKKPTSKIAATSKKATSSKQTASSKVPPSKRRR